MILYDSKNAYTQAAGVLLFNDRGELLLQHRMGTPNAFIPGGQKEGMESPNQTGIREVWEEMRLKLRHMKLALVDYRTKSNTCEVLHFLFYGGILSNAQIHEIRVDGHEITNVEFLPPDLALNKLDEPTRRRVALALEHISKESFSNYYENQVFTYN